MRPICGNAVYVRRNAAFTLHLGHVTVDMKRRESNETRSQLEHACGVRMRARALHWTYNVRYICIYIQPWPLPNRQI